MQSYRKYVKRYYECQGIILQNPYAHDFNDILSIKSKPHLPMEADTM